MVLESEEILTRSRKKPIRFGRLRPVSAVGWEKFSEHWSLLMFLDLKGNTYNEIGEKSWTSPFIAGARCFSQTENEDGTFWNKIIWAQLLQTELFEWMIRTVSWGYGENPCLGPLWVLASVSLDVSPLAPAPLTQLLLVFLLSSQDQLLVFIHCPPSRHHGP